MKPATSYATPAPRDLPSDCAKLKNALATSPIKDMGIFELCYIADTLFPTYTGSYKAKVIYTALKM